MFIEYPVVDCVIGVDVVLLFYFIGGVEFVCVDICNLIIVKVIV